MQGFKHSALAAALAATLITSAVAQDTAATTEAAPPESQIDPANQRAHDVALGRISQDLSHEMMAALQFAAWSSAAAGLCVDLELDEGKLYADLVKASHDDLPDADDEAMQRHRDFSLIAFGVLTGLRLEEAAADEAAFCSDAIMLANEMGADSYIRQVSTAVPLPAEN